MIRLPVFLLTLLLPLVAHAAKEATPGPVLAAVVSVYDGDTMTVDAHPWPGLTVRVSVHLAGIDTPELRGKCQSEKQKAWADRGALWAAAGGRVWLRNIKLGKYAGRVVADVENMEGKSLAQLLIRQEHGRAYDGGRREGWCP